MKLSDLLLNRYLYKEFRQDIETKDSVYDSVNAIPAAVPAVAAGSAAQDINTSNVYINGTNIQPGSYLLTVGDWGWGQTCVFSSTNLNTVSWSSGTFKTANGSIYNISAGNTGVMSSKTYIYLDLNVSDSAYQHTTIPGDSVGIGKVVVAVAQNGATAATYNLTEANQIVGDNILANTINASKLNVGQLSAITADLGTVNAGYINGLTITGGLFRTATTGQRIEMSSSNTNQLRFYDSSTLFGKLEVYKVGADGYIGLIAQDDGAGFEVYTGIGASAYSSATIFSNGGSFDTSGNASNGYNVITAKNGGVFSMHGGPSGDEIDCDIPFNGILFWENNTAGGNKILLQAPASFTSDWTLTLPTSGGTSGYVLTTDGSGNTSWAAAATSGANTALSNLASVAINTSLVSDTNATDNLGSSSIGWQHLYLAGSGNIYFNNNIAFDFSTSATSIWAGSAGFSEFSPYGDITMNLGSPSYRWNSFYTENVNTNAVGSITGTFTGLLKCSGSSAKFKLPVGTNMY